MRKDEGGEIVQKGRIEKDEKKTPWGTGTIVTDHSCLTKLMKQGTLKNK